jgi:hypothetical protein
MLKCYGPSGHRQPLSRDVDNLTTALVGERLRVFVGTAQCQRSARVSTAQQGNPSKFRAGRCAVDTSTSILVVPMVLIVDDGEQLSQECVTQRLQWRRT